MWNVEIETEIHSGIMSFLEFKTMVKLDNSGSRPSLGESRVLTCLTKVSNPPLRETQHCSLSVWLLLLSQCHTSSWRIRWLSKHFHSYRQTSLIPPCALFHNKPHGNFPLLSVAYLQNVLLSGEGRCLYPFVTVDGILDLHSSRRISDCDLRWRRQRRVFRVCGVEFLNVVFWDRHGEVT